MPAHVPYQTNVYVCVCVDALVRLPHTHTHTHTAIKISFVNFACSVLPLAAWANALNFYFRLSQFAPATKKKHTHTHTQNTKNEVFFICLTGLFLVLLLVLLTSSLAWPEQALRIKTISWWCCCWWCLCHYYVYVTYTQCGRWSQRYNRAKLNFRTFAGNNFSTLIFGAPSRILTAHNPRPLPLPHSLLCCWQV